MVKHMETAFALVIDEPAPGQFLWSVIQPKGAGEKAVVVDFALVPLPTEMAAAAAGHAALRRIQAAGSGPGSAWGGNFAETLPGQLE